MLNKYTSPLNFIRNLFIVFIIFFVNHMALASVLPIQTWKTTTGTPVYFVATPGSPMMVLQVTFDAGSARDNSLPGMSYLVNDLLNQGNSGKSSLDIAKNFENVGAEYTHSINRDMACVQLTSLVDEKTQNLALNNFMLLFHPDFKDEAIAREKQLQKAALLSSLDSPEVMAQKTFLKTLYLNHPYGQPLLGEASTIDAMASKDVRAFYQTYYVAENAVISLVGPMSFEDAKVLAERITQELPRGKKAPALPEAQPAGHANTLHIPFKSTQTLVRMGMLGIDPKDPNYFPLSLGNYILGGDPLLSELSQAVRVKRGLTYSITSSFEPLMARGPFIIGVGTRSSKIEETLEATQATFDNFLKVGPNADELNAAKQFLTGNFPLRFDSSEAIVNVLSHIGFYDLPLDYLDTYVAKMQQVTTQDIQKAFELLMKDNPQIIVMVGQETS